MINSAARSPRVATTGGLPATGGSSASVVFVDPNIRGSIRETENHKTQLKTRQDYCRRLDKMINWVDAQITSEKIRVTTDLIRDLSDEEKADETNFYQSTKDFNYDVLPPDVIKAYISSHKYKPGNEANEKREQYGFDHLRKNHDAVLYGAARSKKLLPVGYREEMATYLDSLEKERSAARKRGELTEEEADPIRFPLYKVICDYAVSVGDAFLWIFTILLWHCMARPINVDDISLNNFSLGVDSVIIKFNDTKKDKKGKRVSPKNCYSYPMDPTVCLTTSLAVYLITTDNEWVSESKKHLFIHSGSKAGSGSSRFNSKFADMGKKIRSKISEFIRLDHFDPYGLRKGSSTHASTSTTAPPPVPSIVLRGEWSLGEVLDIYWKWAEAGDQYLGRVLAGFQPNSASFEQLPPHFTVGFENPTIKRATNLCFPKLLHRLQSEESYHVRGLLLRTLASVVYHSDYLASTLFASNIPLLNDCDLLHELKTLVTTSATAGMPHSTGIPPHVELVKKLDCLLEMIMEERKQQRIRDEQMSEMLKQAIDEKAAQAGQITAAVLERMLERGRNELTKQVDDMLREHLGERQTAATNINVASQPGPLMIRGGYSVYSYDGKLDWDVPSNWMLPSKCSLKNAWNLWFCGVKNENIIRPFRLFTKVPSKDWKKLKVEWFPIMKLLSRCPSLDNQILHGPPQPEPERLSEEFDKAMAYVLEQVSYLKDAKKNSAWTVSTWSKRISRSSIMKNGNEEDKDKVGEESRYNKPHSQKRHFEASNTKTAKEKRINQALHKFLGADDAENDA